MEQKGMLIVIEGQDGSGKATQAKLLAKRIRATGEVVKMLEFPRHGRKSASLVDEYLRGAFGTVNEVTPKAASIFYAADRFAASREFTKWLEKGAVLIADRYVSSNEAHQGVKFAIRKARENFWRWNEELEYSIFGIPKPDKIYYLHTPSEISEKLIHKRNKKKKNIEKDIHESDTSYLKRTENIYEELSRRSGKWKRIECAENGEMKSKEDIHELVWKDVQKLLTKKHGT